MRGFWDTHPDSEQQLQVWHSKVKLANWKNSTDIRNDYRNARFVGNNRVIINIIENKFRLVTSMNYDFGILYIRFIGTHKDYGKINVTTI